MRLVAGLLSEDVGEQLPRSGPSESANLRRKSGVTPLSQGLMCSSQPIMNNAQVKQVQKKQAPANGVASTITSPTVATNANNAISAEDVAQQERVRRLSQAGCASRSPQEDIIGNYRGLAVSRSRREDRKPRF